MRYHFTKWQKFFKADKIKRWPGCGATRTFTHYGGRGKLYSHFGKQGVSSKVKHILSVQPGNCTSRYLSCGNKNTCPHKDLQVMFTAALFTTPPK